MAEEELFERLPVKHLAREDRIFITLESDDEVSVSDPDLILADDTLGRDAGVVSGIPERQSGTAAKPTFKASVRPIKRQPRDSSLSNIPAVGKHSRSEALNDADDDASLIGMLTTRPTEQLTDELGYVVQPKMADLPVLDVLDDGLHLTADGRPYTSWPSKCPSSQ